jgi:phosphoribosylformimino-5-aminoimidazole carboxamide ribotide isomerase
VKIIPVIDLMHGEVVRAIAGRRDQYRPIVSRLTDSSAPLAIAFAFREYFGLNEIYIADLDAIAGLPVDLRTFDSLHDNGFKCWVDAGIRTTRQASALLLHASGVITGLETLNGPTELERICDILRDRSIFSLDLRDGAALGDTSTWDCTNPYDIAKKAIRLGVHRMIVLDLERVGTATGPGTDELCSRIRSDFPDTELYAGGGVRTVADVHRFADLGVTGLLIASSLHDGTISRADLEMK